MGDAGLHQPSFAMLAKRLRSTRREARVSMTMTVVLDTDICMDADDALALDVDKVRAEEFIVSRIASD